MNSIENFMKVTMRKIINCIKIFFFEMKWDYEHRNWKDNKQKEKALLKAKIKYRKTLEMRK